MSSSSSSSSASQRSNEHVNLTSSSIINPSSTSFAPLHRTAELENLHDQINDDNDKQIPLVTPPKTTSSRKILTKCMTVIGDGSDKQI